MAATTFLFDPFRVMRRGYARFRGRCPRLLYESLSGILSVLITPGVQPEIWVVPSPQGGEGWRFYIFCSWCNLALLLAWRTFEGCAGGARLLGRKKWTKYLWH